MYIITLAACLIKAHQFITHYDHYGLRIAIASMTSVFIKIIDDHRDQYNVSYPSYLYRTHDFAFLFSCFGIIFGVGLLYVEKVTSHLL